jgi:hypothetical protein
VGKVALVKIRTALKLTVLGLAGYGGYTLWNQYAERFGGKPGKANADLLAPAPRRIHERSELTVEEWAAGSDDPVAQATAILTDSDERSRLPRTADGIEHRRSEDTVEPPS